MSALNYCDVAFVRGGDLARAVRILVTEGHGSVFLQGGDDRVRDVVFTKLAARGFGARNAPDKTPTKWIEVSLSFR